MKYIKIEDLDCIIDELKQEGFCGMVNHERLVKRLSKVKKINIPRINDIDVVLTNIKSAIENNLEFSTNSSINTSEIYLTKSEISNYINVSRPTLDKYLKYCESMGWKLSMNRIQQYNLLELLKYMEKIKIEQDKK